MLNRLKPALAAACATVFIGLTQTASAQDVATERDFCADRPGKGTPTCILDVGRVQLEVGLFDGAIQRDDDIRAEGWAAADLFVRFGLTPLTEIQFGVTPYVREEVEDRGTGMTETAEGTGDLMLGLRHSLANPDGSGFSVAIAGYVTAPTGSDEVSSGEWAGGVVLPISMPLNDEWSLSLSPGIDAVADADGDGHHAAYVMVAGVGRGFGQWDLGAEIWVSHDDDPLEAVTQATFDLTAVWSPPFTADAQLDFGLNFGLNEDSPDVEFGVGLARRF